MRNLKEYSEIMSAREISEYLDISYAKGLYLLKYTNIPSIKIGHIFKVSRNAFESWINDPCKKVLV